MGTREFSSDTTSYERLDNCLENLVEKCKKLNISSVAFAKYGCGLDKLDWNKVKSIINKRVIGQNIQCTVYLNSEVVNNLNEVDLSLDTKLKQLQKKDEFASGKIKEIEKKKKVKGYILENGVLLKLRKTKNNRIYKQLVVPNELKSDVFKLCHENFTGSHLGEKKTWIKLNNRFYWPNSCKDTINYVQSCEHCAKMKNPPPNRANLNPITDFEKPFDKVAIDILELTRTNSGNKYVVVFSDYLTKWAEAFPIRDMSAETIAKIFINKIVTRHSAPSELLSDQGANFMSNLIKSVCEYFRINKINTSPYNPKCDGLVERFNKTLCQMLASYCNSNQTNWDLYLPLVLFAYRTSQQTTSKESPFTLLYGREPRLPSDLDSFNNHYCPNKFFENLHESWLEAKRHIMKQAEENKRIYDNKYLKDPPVYTEGESVRIKNPATKIGLKKKIRNDWWSD